MIGDGVVLHRQSQNTGSAHLIVVRRLGRDLRLIGKANNSGRAYVCSSRQKGFHGFKTPQNSSKLKLAKHTIGKFKRAKGVEHCFQIRRLRMR